jgi:hypothetical protein
VLRLCAFTMTTTLVSTYVCELFRVPCGPHNDDKPIFVRRTLYVYHDSGFRQCVDKNRNPISVKMTPRLQPIYTAAEVRYYHVTVWQYLA